jgi:hypothetical protein
LSAIYSAESHGAMKSSGSRCCVASWDAHFEAMQWEPSKIATEALSPKAAVVVLEVGKRAPEESLGELRIAHLVLIGEVFVRGRSDRDGREDPCF